MSGIVALFHRDGRPVDEGDLWSMLQAAPYRGPDGMSCRTWTSVGLGHAKMAVTPEDEHEQQPLASPRTGCTILADVRLDNRDELLSRLPDRLPPSTGDAEIILRAYEAWGLDALPRLLGDFAFMIWDPREQQLVCARDTSGQRSLFYRIDRRTFAAASEIQQLLQDRNVPVAPNEDRVRDFLVPLNMARNEKQQAETFYHGIYAVPAGHVLIVDRDTTTERQYWNFPTLREVRYRRDEDYAEHFRELFFGAVRSRMRSFRPIGALLSGGLDSSSVVCAAQELYRSGECCDHGFTSFSFVDDGQEWDERGYICEMPAKYGFEALYLTCGKYAGRLQLEPTGFREAPNVGIPEARDAVFGAAHSAGIRAVLTGDLADACVGGSRVVFDSLLRRLRLGLLLHYLRSYRRAVQEPCLATLVFGCLAPLLPMQLQRLLHRAYLRRAFRRGRQPWLPEWISEPLRRDLGERHVELCLAAEHGRRFSNPGREAEYRLLYPPEAARHPAPWPVEIWRPYADRRLHQFLLAIPPEQKFRPHPESDAFYAGSKSLVRRAMRGIVPESIRTRVSKANFNAVVENEVKQNWPAYEAAFGPSSRPEIATRGYVVHQAFWQRILALRSGMIGRDILYLMELIGLETWFRALKLSPARPINHSLSAPSSFSPVPT